TDVREIEDGTVPEQFVLKQNYPNPFGKSSIAGNAVTTIEYSIPLVEAQNIAPLPIVLKIYNILGRKIATLVDEEQTPGIYRVNFDASKLSNGVYFYQLRAGAFVQSKKMIVLR
ncbi:MAG: T9SS type A sorting domain-containing protein, partial [Chlorobi bacterium]|nr:T9SS type A sorting domain-containing protein [Chlorobiota bacterium]